MNPPPMPVPTPPQLPPRSTPPPLPRRKLMLGWKALIPIIAMIVVQVTLHEPPDDGHDYSTGDPYLIAFHLGSIIGVLFFALVPTWIAYRLFGRARDVAHITFFVLMLLFIVSLGQEGIRRKMGLPPTSQRQSFGGDYFPDTSRQIACVWLRA